MQAQPPSGGCVLKHGRGKTFIPSQNQPPSGGCVLKRHRRQRRRLRQRPAAFRRLCVETAARC